MPWCRTAALAGAAAIRGKLRRMQHERNFRTLPALPHMPIAGSAGLHKISKTLLDNTAALGA
jgi:hypothetical protein